MGKNPSIDYLGGSMNFKEYLKTWDGLLAENRWNRLMICGLIAVTALLSLKVLSKETVVVLQPVTLSDEAYIIKNDASRSYQEAWAAQLALLIGNVTPASATFMKERIGPLLSPKIYAETMEAVELQVSQIRNDRVSIRFEPREIIYEDGTGKVFVYGNSFTKTVNGKEDRSERTYEFIIEIDNYLPRVTYIDTYSAKPRTLRIVDQEQRREKMQREREERANR